MKKLSPKEFSQSLSLYLDGALDEQSRQEFEAYLAANPEAASELEILKKQQQLLKSQPAIPSNEWFWQRLSARLEEERNKRETVYPFSRKYLPLAASLTILIAASAGVLLFQQRSLLTKFFSEKKEEVQHLYQENILQGKLLPLFSSLNNDQVLQFAFFGTLPLDAQANTALRVDESKENGARIEFAKNETKQHPQVTVQEFCDVVDATSAQQRIVDSILTSAKEKIEKSVFLGENKALAVHADLAKFNRMTMSHLAASLDLPQRKKFQKFLITSHSPYTFAVVAAPSPNAPRTDARAPRGPRSARMEQFVVITPESCSLAQINVDLENVRQNIELTAQEFQSVNARAHALIREFSARARLPRTPNSPFRVFSGSDYFSVRVEHNALEPSRDEMPLEVMARAPQAIRFRYESQEMPEIEKFFNDDSEASIQVFNNGSRKPSAEARKFDPLHRRGIDLDSIINLPRDRKSQPRVNQIKKRYNNPFEL
jgi:hypothetical protein